MTREELIDRYAEDKSTKLSFPEYCYEMGSIHAFNSIGDDDWLREHDRLVIESYKKHILTKLDEQLKEMV